MINQMVAELRMIETRTRRQWEDDAAERANNREYNLSPESRDALERGDRQRRTGVYQTTRMPLLATYIAKSGKLYTDDTHSGCLFQAVDTEPECKGFPHGNIDVGDLESRMGFVDNSGKVWTRDETMAKFGFDLAEDQ